MKFIGQITSELDFVTSCESISQRLTGEVFTPTAQRLIRYGCTEPESYVLARIMLSRSTTLERTATESEVEAAVIEALVSAKQSIDGVPEVEYLGGQRRDTLRLEERQ
jgi:hypothetical protein